jgi:hypothetical protein
MSTTLADPVEVRIVDEVVATLGTITSANDEFYSDPRRIYELYGNSIEVSEIPCLIVTPLKSEGSHDCPNGTERIDLMLAITCVTDPIVGGALDGAFDETHRDIRRMAADVRKVLQADLKRGGLAIDTIIPSTDIFDAIESQPVAAAELVITIPFRHLTADPTQAQ